MGNAARTKSVTLITPRISFGYLPILANETSVSYEGHILVTVIPAELITLMSPQAV